MNRMLNVITEDDIDREEFGDWEEDNPQSVECSEDPEKILVDVMNQYGYPNLPEIMKRSGKAPKELIERLKLYQDPLLYDIHRDEEADYMLASRYLDGKHYYKLLTEAKEMNQKYPGRFFRNLKLLKRYKPKVQALTVDDINFGRKCLARNEYGVFIKDLLQLKFAPSVQYSNDNKYLIEYVDEPSRVVDNYKYGTVYRSARKIIQNLMNGDDNVVKTAHLDTATGKVTYRKDEDQTIAVLEKEKLILKEFKKFIKILLKDADRAERVYERHARQIGGYISLGLEDKGRWLTFPGLTRNPYAWQRAAVEDGLFHKAYMMVVDTGGGKSMAMVALANELKRMNLCSRIMFVLPNGSMMDFVKEAESCYPDNNYLIISNTEFSKDKQKFLNEIMTGDYDAVMMAQSSYDMIDMSKKYYLNQKKQELRRLKSAYSGARHSEERRALKHQIKILKKELSSLELKVDQLTDCFEKLGIDALFVDECQNYRRIAMKSGHGHVVGVAPGGAKKSQRHKEKTHYTLYHHENGRVVFATATPHENSLAETYVYQKYLQEEDLNYLSLSSLQEWFKEFVDPIPYFGSDDGENFKLKTKLRFHNLPELNHMLRAFTFYHHLENGELSLPKFKGFLDVIVPATEKEVTIFKELLEIESPEEGDERKEFNPLTAVVMGRMAALDIRLIDPTIVPEPGSTKVEACLEKILEFYHRYPDKTQVVFCDTGVPKKGFNIYDTLKNALLKTGIFQSEEIRFIHEAETAVQKKRMLADFNAAKIKILIGSTQKLGVGVNIQRNLVVAHFLDVPWTPAKLQQKMGRIIRAGNSCDEVFIIRYIKQRSYDAVSWEIVENKLEFIHQFNSFQYGENYRESDDITPLTELTCAEAKALALDDNDIKKRAELENDIKRIKSAYKTRATQLMELREKTNHLPKEIREHEKYTTIISKDISHYQESRQPLSRTEREKIGMDILTAVQESQSGKMFEYQGFDIVVPKKTEQDEIPKLILYGTAGGQYMVELSSETARGTCQVLDNFLGRHLKTMLENHEISITKKMEELVQASRELLNGNEFSDRLDELTEELALLEEELGLTL